MKKRLFFCLFYLVFAIQIAFCQFQVTTYQATDGLPSELAKALVQDTLGFIWVGSDDGLIRFNGIEYQQFKSQLPSQYVKGLIIRQNGQLIASTDLGIVEINYSSDTVQFNRLFRGESNKSNISLWYPKLLFEDSEGQLWFSDNHAVFRYDTEDQLHRYQFDDKVIPNSYNRSFSISEDSNHQIWALSQTGYFFRFNPQTDSFDELPKDPDINDVFASIHPTKDVLWASTNLGLVSFKIQDGQLSSKKVVIPNANISSFSFQNNGYVIASSWIQGVYQIATDGSNYQKINNYPFKNGNSIFTRPESSSIWITSDNGLVLLKKRIFESKFQDYSNTYIQSLTKDDSLIYYSDGNTIYKASAKDNKPQPIFHLPNHYILQLEEMNDHLWAASSNGYIYQLSKNGVTKKQFDLTKDGNGIFQLVGDTAGNIWYCQDGLKGVGCIDTKGKARHYQDNIQNKIISIKRSPSGALYLGGTSDNAYLYQYNPATEQMDNLSHPLNFEHNVLISINDIAFHKQHIWLATNFGLLKQTETSVNRTDLGNLTTEAVKALAIDQNDDVWLANSNGLLRYDGESTYIFDEKNGIPSKILGYRNLLIDHASNLWIGTVSGLGVGNISFTTPHTATPILLRVETKGRKKNKMVSSITTADYLKLSLISPEYPTKFIHYQMRLLGSESEEWQTIEKPEIFFTNLSRGTYTVEVRARQQGNYNWSNPATYSFEVKVIWYSTWWGILIIVMTSMSIIFLLMWANTVRLKNKQAHLSQIIKEHTHSIQQAKDEIEMQNEELTQHQHELQATLENLRQAQTQLVQAEKMSSLGQLTAGIAHEINNPINFVYAGSDVLRDFIEDVKQIFDVYEKINPTNSPEDLKRYLEELQRVKEEVAFHELKDDISRTVQDIRTGAERTKQIVDSLKTFSRIQESEIQPANIHENLDATLTIAKNQFNKGITIHKNYEEYLPYPECNIGEINQVFMNLIINAAQAIQGPGSITISTKHITAIKSIQVRISDTGSGMDSSVISKIFEPFFTTKAIGKGTGLGLSISHGIIEKHQGALNVESEIGKGTTFIITLPTHHTTK